MNQFKKKSEEAKERMEEEKHDSGENGTEPKKGLLASAGGLVVNVGDGNGDLMGWGEEDQEDEHDQQDEEEKIKRKDNQILANFFRPVQRQISEIIRDVSLAASYLCLSAGAPVSNEPPHYPIPPLLLHHHGTRLAMQNFQWRPRKQKLRPSQR